MAGTSRMVRITSGGVLMTVSLETALDLVICGAASLGEGEVLTTQEIAFALARADPTWPARHGHYPQLSEF